VVWEAQYGDFVNGAQVILDEYMVSARAKWGLRASLVLLLPHGFEGQGPDHSTGRPERFLESAADINLRLANCTTAAQYFHLLRRQALLLETDPLPLVVLTPKSLLRHTLVASTPRQLAEGRFQPVIDDADAAGRRTKVRRLVLCSGKVFVDLVSAPERATGSRVALCRVEQLYPLPEGPLSEVIAGYRNLEEVVWLQEEPMNMGAWTFVRPRLEELLGDRLALRYVGRPRSASPAEGSAALHHLHQRAIVAQAYDLSPTARAAALAPSK
jgi:2-oxoglutarate dehydrogenase E1 component